MGKTTGISWTDSTFNIAWGCTKVSPGCTNCYAETFSKRTGHSIWGPASRRRLFSEKHWDEPRRWNKEAKKAGVRRRVFCSSMADVFEDHRDLDSERERLWKLIGETPDLDWQLLTKRPENMLAMAPWKAWPDNVWAGTTTENQEWFDRRIGHLLGVPAKVRWLSVEPMLGPVRLPAGIKDGKDLHWVIIGGESGHGARRMNPRWVVELIDDCRSRGIACFVKQKGAALAREWGCADPKGGDPSEWPDWMKVQQFPEVLPA